MKRNVAKRPRVRLLNRRVLNVSTETVAGIWMSKAKDSNVLVLDVEGTDGRERGEDQVDFLL